MIPYDYKLFPLKSPPTKAEMFKLLDNWKNIKAPINWLRLISTLPLPELRRKGKLKDRNLKFRMTYKNMTGEEGWGCDNGELAKW